MAKAAQTIEQKAHAYLLAGKIRVVELGGGTATLHAQGTKPAPYVVTWTGHWTCTCPAHVADCAHVVASRLICPEWGVEVQPKLGKEDPVLDALFEGLPAPEVTADDYIEWEATSDA